MLDDKLYELVKSQIPWDCYHPLLSYVNMYGDTIEDIGECLLTCDIVDRHDAAGVSVSTTRDAEEPNGSITNASVPVFGG